MAVLESHDNENNTNHQALYACCPACAYRLCQCYAGTHTMQMCPKCKADVDIQTDNHYVKITLIAKPH